MTYPFVVEPLFTLRTQILTWSVGYVVLILLIAAAAVIVARAGKPSIDTAGPATVAAPTIAERTMWTVFAAIPAGLVVAVTAAISTDLAAAPFLWVLPLSLYLLTFVAIFRDRAWVAHGRVLSLVPFAAVALIATASSVIRPYWSALLVVHLVSFVVLALACHGELYRRRPEPARLTEFYLWTSFGGVIGGIFAGLIAPHVFNGIAEYPILILAALLAMPGAFAGGPSRFLRQSGPGLVLAALAATLMWLHVRVPANAALPVEIGLILLAGAMVLVRRQPAWFFGLAVLAFVIASLEPAFSRIEQVRSFFGVHRVVEDVAGRLPAPAGWDDPAWRRTRTQCGWNAGNRPPRADDVLLFRRADRRRDRSVPRRAGAVGSKSQRLGSAPAVSLAIDKTAKRGRFSSSIRMWSASHATRPCSGSCRHADRICASCWEMRG